MSANTAPGLAQSDARPARFRFAHGVASLVNRGWPFKGGHVLARAVSRALLPPLTGPTWVQTSLGFSLRASRGDGGFYYYLGCYEPGTLHVMRRCLRPGDTFVDIGASIGQMSLYASALVGDQGRVLAFEPHPGRHASLRAAIDFNAARNIRAFACALDEQADAAVRLYEGASPSLLQLAGDEGRFSTIETRRLADVLREEGLSATRMLKIDVEGSETKVLRGSGTLLEGPDAPILCIEISDLGGGRLEPLHYALSRNQYRIFNLRRSKNCASKLVELAAPEQVRPGDNAFCFHDAHLRELGGDSLLFARPPG
jgi:FkbM family methyltransferase